jgi:heptosyltransferase-2
MPPVARARACMRGGCASVCDREAALPKPQYPTSLIVRLPNHLGDTCMALPALELLAAHGIALTLAGRGWARELFTAYPWAVAALPGARRARVQALRTLRRASVTHPQERAGLLLTNSFSSALEFRLAGLRPCGYATDARRLLLGPAIAVPRSWRADLHTVGYYLHLVQCLLALDGAPPVPAPPAVPQLRLDEAAHARARAALARPGAPTGAPADAKTGAQVGTRAGYVVVCPVAQGRHHGHNKCWSGFGRLTQALVADGRDVVTCPGPGEQAAAAAAVPHARMIKALDLGAFAALLAGSALVVANDSGPGHLAAAVGAQLLGIFGVTDPAKTCPQGSTVRIVGGAGGWPSYEEVAAAAGAALAPALAPVPASP